ncbi:hypothetical protein F2Q69_00006255 [Brassica cretica]|uniref:At2g29880-like C-terminal domain-containing protein n=1 Tax=Brassica cretica TaxID=69181 RepID=A0A8S9NUY0_BRACR|nr:hypothetical protein F2Q69_00006255 [Brassica cretica]
MRVFNKVKSLLVLPNSVYNGASAITRCIMRRYSASDLLNIQEVSVVVARLCVDGREIPDLDDDLRYEEMTLVHCLGMKSVVAPPPDLILQRTLDISPLFLLVLFWVPNFLFAENTKHIYQL